MYSHLSRHVQRRSPRGNPPPYRVGELIWAYVIAVLINLATLLILPAILIVYPITGLILSRFISRRIIWWDYAANIENVAATKLQFLLTWPVAMPRFIAKAAVARFF
jgi:hypothetical protein